MVAAWIARVIVVLGTVGLMNYVVESKEDEALIKAKATAKEVVRTKLKESFGQFFWQKCRSEAVNIAFLFTALFSTYFLPKNLAIIVVAVAYFYISGLLIYRFYQMSRRFFPLLKEHGFNPFKAAESYIYLQAYEEIFPQVKKEKDSIWDVFSTRTVQELTAEIAREAAKNGAFLIKQWVKKFLWLFLCVSALFLFLRRSLPQLVGNIEEMTVVEIMIYPFLWLIEIFA